MTPNDLGLGETEQQAADAAGAIDQPSSPQMENQQTSAESVGQEDGENENKSAARKLFGNDTEKVYNAYDSLLKKYSGDLGDVKHRVKQFEQTLNRLGERLAVLDKLPELLSSAGQSQPQPQEPPRQPEPQNVGYQPTFKPEDMYDETSMAQALQREFQRMMALQNSSKQQQPDLDGLVNKLQQTVDERLMLYQLEQEKKALLEQGVPENLLRLAAFYADNSKATTFSEALQALYKDFPNLRPQAKPAPAVGLQQILPKELFGGQLGQANDADVLKNMLSYSRPSDVLFNTKK